jgi:protein-L-isoaspartate(D-aspartate) O-methyltransferase
MEKPCMLFLKLGGQLKFGMNRKKVFDRSDRCRRAADVTKPEKLAERKIPRMTDFNERRRVMVDTQIRPSDVTKFPIIEAMLSVPREKFVSDAQREAAYSGGNVELGTGRVLLEPRTLAKILDALDVSGSELVLDIGCGFGYSSAVVARMAQAVVAVEEDEAMISEAQEILSEIGADNVILHTGSLVDGAEEHGPYDVILVQGGIGELPVAIENQLKDGGRIACIFMDGALGSVSIGHKFGDVITWRFDFNAGAPILAGFEKQHSFTL